MPDMPADVADADAFDAVLDKDGCIWVRLYTSESTWEWSYLSEHNEVSWDIHSQLPEQYAPYRGLDEAATQFIKFNLVLRTDIAAHRLNPRSA